MSKKRSKINELRAENERLREKLELKGMVYEGGGVWRRASDPYPKDEDWTVQDVFRSSRPDPLYPMILPIGQRGCQS